ncbi:MAG: hypothetical protein BWY52_03161 [Chloroflexi bacterium ADurb.Bin325]|nr:MAG: hypothetical protein BWY52_03161 [Chloroflexi bacterium ADurb.Bin325]
MSRRLNLIALIALVLMMVVAPVQAQDAGTKQVGLVIAFPDGTQHTEVVTVPADATTFDALKAAKIELASQETSFGPAVCSINKTGCPADDCFCNDKEFWAYFHLDNGQWASAMEGVGAYVPAAGAVEGFAWSASDENFNPTVKPAVMTFAQLASSSGSGAGQNSVLLIVAIIAVIVIAALVVLYLRRAKR